MSDPTRFEVGWCHDREDAEAVAKKIAFTFDWLRGVPALTGTAVYYPREPRLGPRSAESVPELRGALEEASFPMRLQNKQTVHGYKQFFYFGTLRSWTVAATVLGGISAPMHGVPTPNRFELRVNPRLEQAELRQILVGLINVFRPVWATCASIGLLATMPPGADTPPVGYLTYLSSWFGDVPTLEGDAIVTKLPGLGTIVQSHPGGFEPARSEERRAMSRAEAALRKAGTLRPFTSAPLP